MRIKLLVLLSFILLSFNSNHDYYLSTTTVQWVPAKKQIQLTSRFFLEDIEALMQEKTDEPVVFLPDSNPTAIDAFVKNFYSENLSIALENSPQKIHYLGREYKDDLLVIYGEISLPIERLNTLNVKATFLIDFLVDQQNIVHLVSPDQKKSFLLTNQKITFDFSFH